MLAFRRVNWPSVVQEPCGEIAWGKWDRGGGKKKDQMKFDR